jgi:aspartate kinase
MKKDAIVAKFGGTSMGTPESLEKVAAIIAARAKRGEIRAVVVSAMSGVTNALLSLPHQKNAAASKKILKEIEQRHVAVIENIISPEHRSAAHEDISNLLGYLTETLKGLQRAKITGAQASDYLASYGERLSAHLLTHILNDRDVQAEYLNARAVVLTDDQFGEAKVDFRATNKAIAAYVAKHTKLQVVTGFIGATKDGRTTTLGRGGSDYSAAIFGAALGVSMIEIWTDVSGIYTADPRLVKSARPVQKLSFEEAGELAYFGAKVLHPKTILPAMRHGIPVHVLNTFSPQDPGTVITPGFEARRSESRHLEALSFKRPVFVVHIQSPEFFDSEGLLARIFSVFQEEKVSIDLVATSVAGVSLTIDTPPPSALLKKLTVFGKVSFEAEKAILCAVGGSINAAGVAADVFTTLGKQGIGVELISQAARGVSLTFVVAAQDAERALAALHKKYIG